MKRMTVFLIVLILSIFSFSMCSPDGGNDGGNDGGDDTLPPELEGVEKRDMVSVTGGEYNQESTDTEGPDPYSFSHTLSDFSIGKFEVTYELWYLVYQWSIKPENGYTFENKGMEGSVTGGGENPNFNNVGKEPTDAKYEPATMVSWRDAVVWCNAYSELMGYRPVYRSGEDVIKSSCWEDGAACDNATVDWSANGYRLPTEGEWQYAASYKDVNNFTPHDYASGASGNYEDHDACKEVAWYKKNAGGKTHPVGEKKANSLGLHDMSGNVCELLWDRIADYPTGPETDYAGPDSGELRVERGGSWFWSSGDLPVGARLCARTNNRFEDAGFRVVRRPAAEED